MKKRTDISQLRFKYKKNPLDIKNSDSNPFKQFNKWMKESIRNKIFEPTAMSLSTVNKRNKVSNRIVLLKGVVNNSFVFYTNLKSRKSYELNYLFLIFFITVIIFSSFFILPRYQLAILPLQIIFTNILVEHIYRRYFCRNE